MRVRVLVTILVFGMSTSIFAQESSIRVGGQIPAEVDGVYQRGLGWLANAQTDTGGWRGNSHSGSGVDGICLMAFLASGDDPNFGRYSQNIRRAIRAIVKQQDAKSGYIPNSMYHHGFAMLALAEAYGAMDETLVWKKGEQQSIAKALNLAIKCAVTSQKNNRWGGWRYSPNAQDADTSVTGAILMGLLAARNAGMNVPDEAIDKGMEYMRRSTGKDGSVAYSGGLGGMGGSMNLTAIAVLTGSVSRSKDTEEYEACLSRLRDNLENPINHYPEYFRYYVAQALFQSDYATWKKWNASIARQLSERQSDDGSFGGPYNTGMSLLALALNYRFLPIYER